MDAKTEDLDPIAQAKLLQETPPKRPMSTKATNVAPLQKCSVYESGGKAVLKWDTDQIGKYDWVGLYPGASGGWDSYLTRQWQWVRTAQKGEYKTGTKYAAGQQARYNIWDYGLKGYKTVATS